MMAAGIANRPQSDYMSRTVSQECFAGAYSTTIRKCCCASPIIDKRVLGKTDWRCALSDAATRILVVTSSYFYLLVTASNYLYLLGAGAVFSLVVSCVYIFGSVGTRGTLHGYSWRT